jgi:methionine-rich copper-binding protein CopC
VRDRHRIILALSLFWIVLPISPAEAHSSLITSTPVVNANLAKLPAYVAVTFDENLLIIDGAKTNVLQVSDVLGKAIDAGNSSVAGPVLRVGINDSSGEGVFTVSWRVVSGDGHPAQGTYKFTVGSKSQIAPLVHNVAQHQGDSFWNHQRERIYLIIAAFIAIGIWVFFDRRRRNLS